MIENTYLGLKSLEQHSHEMESEAVNWELARQSKEESGISEKPTVPLPVRRMMFKLAVAVMIMVIIVIVLISLERPGYAQSEVLPSPEPTLTWSGVGSSGSDAAPSLNLLQ